MHDLNAPPDENEPAMEAPQPFYHVRARALRESPDPRAKREIMLDAMSQCIRDYPTMPADPDDASWPGDVALVEDMAVELPKVHCNFRRCSWRGTKDEDRDEHIVRAHKKE